MLSTQAKQQQNDQRVERWHSDVTSRPTRSRRSARLSVARLQSAGAGLSLKSTRSALGAHLSVWIRTRRLQQQQRLVSLLGSDALLCQHTKYHDRITRGHAARLFAAIPGAASGARGSDAWVLRAVRRTRPDLNNSWPPRLHENLCTHNESHFFSRIYTVGRLFRFANSTAENAIRSRSEELEIWTGRKREKEKKEPQRPLSPGATSRFMTYSFNITGTIVNRAKCYL